MGLTFDFSSQTPPYKDKDMSTPPSEMVTLVSADGVEFPLRRDLALQLKTVAAALEDTQAEDVIPISNVESDVLGKVIQFCEYSALSKTAEEREIWHRDFLTLEHPILFRLILATNFLNYQKLLDLSCKCVADQIRGKTPDEIRAHFNILNDFSPEEEAEIKKENEWAREALK